LSDSETLNYTFCSTVEIANESAFYSANVHAISSTNRFPDFRTFDASITSTF
jgi:hypothetical protein